MTRLLLLVFLIGCGVASPVVEKVPPPEKQCIEISELTLVYCTADKNDPEMDFWVTENELAISHTLWWGTI